MELLVPTCYIKTQENIKKMYISDINIRYVKSQIIYAIRELSPGLSVCADNLKFINKIMAEQNLKKYCDTIQDLHKLNKKIILETAIQIVDEPNMINENYDKDLGIMTRGNYEYTDYSFRGGVWHPEDLFLESEENRNNSYWQPLDVRYDPRNGKFKKLYGVNVNPNEIYKRHYDTIENNTEDRRVNNNRPIRY